MLILDTAEEHGFLPEPQKFASGDDVEVIGRGMKLLKLATGAQARARHESWKKRQVQLPHELKPAAAPAKAVSKKEADTAADEK
jgi:hypothetical protein